MCVYDNRLWLHAHVDGPFTKSRLRHFREVMADMLCELEDRGVERIFTFVGTLPKYRFAQFNGFKATGEIMTVKGSPVNYDIMVLEI